MNIKSTPNTENFCHYNYKTPVKKNTLVVAIILTFLFSIVEAIAGWKSGSLALLSDAGHMLTDVLALVIALVASILYSKKPGEKYSFGLVRVEVLAALANGLSMLIIVAAIFLEAIDRLIHPQTVSGSAVLIVALLGVVLNIFVVWQLHSGCKNLNIRAAFIHVLGDLLGSIAAAIAGVVIILTKWMPIDPILSLVICALTFISTVALLRETVAVLMESVPKHIKLAEVKKDLKACAHVKTLHDLHIWYLASGFIAASAHVVIDDMQNWPKAFNEISEVLDKKYEIKHITIQPEEEI